MKEPIFLHDSDYYYKVAGKNIKKYRKQAGLTQQELADMSTISSHYISQIESGTKNKHFTIQALGYIADALGVDFFKFFIID